MNFVTTYYDEYLERMPLDHERILYYEAVWIIRLLVLLGMGFSVFGLPGVKERLFTRFKTITGVELIYK